MLLYKKIAFHFGIWDHGEEIFNLLFEKIENNENEN